MSLERPMLKNVVAVLLLCGDPEFYHVNGSVGPGMVPRLCHHV